MIYVWIAFGIAGLISPAWKWFQKKRASEWPVTEGRIDSAAIAKPPFSLFSKRAPYKGILSYSYTSAGGSYTGSYTRDFYSEEEAEAFIRGLEGQALAIHYKPSKPSSSALLEPELESLLQSRSSAESYVQSGASNPLPGWSEPFLWFFATLSCVGLVVSLWVHIGALFGRRVAPEAFFWGLHIGIFLVWFPAVIVSQRLVGSANRRDFWKVVLKGSPEWLRYLVYGFFGYAVVNFMLFMMQAPIGKSGGANPPAAVWRGFSGHWMAFYSAAFAILFSAIRAGRNNGRLRNGETISLYQEHCPRCGKLAGDCHCFS